MVPANIMTKMGNYSIPAYITRIWRLKLSRFILVFLGWGSLQAFSQNYTKLCKMADTLYPEADKVVLYKDYHIKVVQEDDTIRFISENKEVNFIRKNSQMHQTEAIYYSSEFSKIDKLEAYTIDVATSKKTRFAGAADGMYFSNHIFYDDNRKTYFVYPNVTDGVVTEMEYTSYYYEPHLLPPFYFSFSEPVINSSLTFTFPLDCEIGWVIKDQGKYKIEFEKKIVNGKNEYKWTLKNSRIMAEATSDASVSKVLPHLIYWIKSYRTKKGKTQVLNGINDLYGWYRGFLNRAKTNNENVVKELCDSVTQHAGSEYEKASAIFGWVQNNVSYVAIEDGYSGFIPRKADDVIRKKYGDCKDMANLLVEMMRYCKLDARHVWIGTRDIPYTYYDIYTPIVDNHMIAAVKLDGAYYFLDATGRFMPFGLPTSMIQGKIGLIEQDKDSFELVKIGVIEAEQNTIRDSVNLSLSGGKLMGTGNYSMSGYPQVESKNSLSYAENNSENKYYKELLLKGNNKFKLLGYKKLTDAANNLCSDISYDFEMSDYVSFNGNELFINMNINKTQLTTLKKEKVSTNAFTSNEYNYVHKDVFSLTIPEGYTLSFVPADNELNTDFITYHNQYISSGNRLTLVRTLVVDYLEIEETQIEDYNSLVNEIQKIERSNVLLINKK
jgi:hypothetical protein